MNTSLVHPSGALLLEPLGQVVIEVKLTNGKEAVPITYDTPAEKIKGQLNSKHCSVCLKIELLLLPNAIESITVYPDCAIWRRW